MFKKEISCQLTPNQSSVKYDTTNLLADLGRATRRGVKKCPNCGFVNGTRGYICKNAACNTVLKDSEKRKIQLDSVKLETGTNRQIYSVRVRDKGPDSRGFVQLPYYKNEEKNILSEDALCFVDTCQRLFDNSILKCHEHENDTENNTSTICIHIESALKSINIATPLEFKHDLINHLNVDDDIKKRLCGLAKSTNGPVVQKVSKMVLAVKCQVTSTNPLGYLHFMLSSSSSKSDGTDYIDQYYCACSDNQGKLVDKKEKCLHYYALVCAFASDSKFLNKYFVFINAEFDPIVFTNIDISDIISTSPILKNNILEYENTNDLEIEVLQPHFNIFVGCDKTNENIINMPCELLPSGSRLKTTKKNKLKKSKSIERKRNIVKFVNKNEMSAYFDVMSFNEWLPSVTEQINESIFYGACTPDPLIFQIPSKFFELIRDRICFGTTKMRLPNTTTTIVRKKPPHGTFYKSSWHITNILHLKQIFDTNKIPLTLTKNYTQNLKGEFLEYNYVAEENTYAKKPIRPAQFSTYLKVGNTELNQKEPTPFIIEWTPDLYKVSKFGELRLIFQFGHKDVKNL